MSLRRNPTKWCSYLVGVLWWLGMMLQIQGALMIEGRILSKNSPFVLTSSSKWQLTTLPRSRFALRTTCADGQNSNNMSKIEIIDEKRTKNKFLGESLSYFGENKRAICASIFHSDPPKNTSLWISHHLPRENSCTKLFLAVVETFHQVYWSAFSTTLSFFSNSETLLYKGLSEDRWFKSRIWISE